MLLIAAVYQRLAQHAQARTVRVDHAANAQESPK